MKVYLACSSVDMTIARMAVQEIREAGHFITFDWTRNFEETEWRADPKQLADRADKDIKGVMTSDVYVLYMTKGMRSIGCLIEMGAALGASKPVLVCEEHESFDHFFHNHPWLYKVPTFGMVLETLKAWEMSFEYREDKPWTNPPQVPFLSEIFKPETELESSRG